MNYVQKQTRQIENGNQRAEEEIKELNRANELRNRKTVEINKANIEISKEIAEVEKDVGELGQCKVVIERELFEEQSYQE